ncbi:MAG: QueT transporter family protein [Beduini sp.]|uniref:QueT transporter family protein n=1 Tax=Beduini sp. TaxID=1922300 RepID=UPI0011C8EDE6
MRFNTKLIAQNAIIACIYTVFTLAIAPLAYSEIQFRLSEIIVFLAFYNKKYIPGLVIGCFIANIPSTLGWLDMVFGTFSTFLVCIAMYKMKNKYLAAFVGALITGGIIGFELHLAFGIPFVVNAIYVWIGELAVLLIGVVLFDSLSKNKKFMEFITK